MKGSLRYTFSLDRQTWGHLKHVARILHTPMANIIREAIAFAIQHPDEFTEFLTADKYDAELDSRFTATEIVLTKSDIKRLYGRAPSRHLTPILLRQGFKPLVRRVDGRRERIWVKLRTVGRGDAQEDASYETSRRTEEAEADTDLCYQD